MTDPSPHRLPCRFRNFELYRPLCLLLRHDCAGRHRLPVTHIPVLATSPAHTPEACSSLTVEESLHYSTLPSTKRTRIAQISFSLNGVFWPTSLPLFEGSRGEHTFAKCSVVVSRCLRNNQSAPELNGRYLTLCGPSPPPPLRQPKSAPLLRRRLAKMDRAAGVNKTSSASSTP
jgi:hypothetical protein